MRIPWSEHATRSPIGIDVSSSSIRAIQLACDDEHGWQCAAATAIPRTGDETMLTDDELAHLADTLERQGFNGRRVVVAMPDSTLIEDSMELPQMEDANARLDVARGQLAASHRFDAVEIELTEWSIPAPRRAGDGANWSMVMGCPRVETESLLDRFESAGFEVCGLDVRPLAIVRGCLGLLTDVDSLCAVLHVDETLARTIITSNGTLIYERRLPDLEYASLRRALQETVPADDDVADVLLRTCGLDEASSTSESIDAAIASRTRLVLTTYAEQIVTELRRPFSYVAQEFDCGDVDRLVLTGEVAAIAGLDTALTQALGTETKTVAPLIPDEAGPCWRLLSSHSLTVATGLAIYPQEWCA